jgi:clan AA aspartic protease
MIISEKGVPASSIFGRGFLMSLAKAKAIGRKRCRLGRLWPMPIRETDLGHIYAELTVRPMAGASKTWTGQALVDTGATDTFLPASVLRKLGIEPSARRSYELADGTEQELPIGFGVIEVEGLAAGATLVFAGEKEEPLLGVTVLESTGLWLDPQRERLIRRPPKRKSGSTSFRWGSGRARIPKVGVNVSESTLTFMP